MASPHWDVNCDGCGSTSLIHYRYKCLRCADYDLCKVCHLRGVETGTHKQQHPFQCLLDREARELHFAGEPMPELCADSFTCPVCGDMGHSSADLVGHVANQHRMDRTPVICPLCVAQPSAHPNRLTNLANHLTIMHPTGIVRGPSSSPPGDDDDSSYPGSANGAGGIRGFGGTGSGGIRGAGAAGGATDNFIDLVDELDNIDSMGGRNMRDFPFGHHGNVGTFGASSSAGNAGIGFGSVAGLGGFGLRHPDWMPSAGHGTSINGLLPHVNLQPRRGGTIPWSGRFGQNNPPPAAQVPRVRFMLPGAPSSPLAPGEDMSDSDSVDM